MRHRPQEQGVRQSGAAVRPTGISSTHTVYMTSGDAAASSSSRGIYAASPTRAEISLPSRSTTAATASSETGLWRQVRGFNGTGHMTQTDNGRRHSSPSCDEIRVRCHIARYLENMTMIKDGVDHTIDAQRKEINQV